MNIFVLSADGSTFKETKCILESDFKACIDLLCYSTTEIDKK